MHVAMKSGSMKVLVVYYSRTGNTGLVAEAIAESLNSNVEEIKDKRDRTGAIGYLRSGYEALFKKLTEIQPINKNPEEYDLVIIGSPVWAGRLSSPVRTYMTEQSRKIKNTAFFATCGINSGKIFSQMEELSKPPIATLEIKEKEVKSDEYLKKVHEFTEKLKHSCKNL